MSSYGRNFEFRISPMPQKRLGRYINGEEVVPIGAPVQVPAGAENDLDGRLPLELVTGDTPPRTGMNGIAIFEHAHNAYAGFDPVLRTESDFGDVPAFQPTQLVSGDHVKVVFRNTTAEDLTFLGRQSGSPRTMVADLDGAAVGDFIRPGAGNDDDGYWAIDGEEDGAWFVVTYVDSPYGEVEAQMLF
jgi:hypothetical protein